MKTTIISLIAIIAVFTLVNFGYDRGMESYCKSLQAQAEEFSGNPDYFITKIDSDECTNVYHVDIVANVK